MYARISLPFLAGSVYIRFTTLRWTQEDTCSSIQGTIHMGISHCTLSHSCHSFFAIYILPSLYCIMST